MGVQQPHHPLLRVHLRQILIRQLQHGPAEGLGMACDLQGELVCQPLPPAGVGVPQGQGDEAEQKGGQCQQGKGSHIARAVEAEDPHAPAKRPTGQPQPT